MKYRIAALLGAAVLMSSSVYAFSDIKNHWASEYIEYLKDREVINGYEEGDFRPDNQMIREEAAALLCKYIDYKEKNGVKLEDKSSNPAKFKDIEEGRWSRYALDKLSRLGAVSGDPDGSFRPEDNITRAEFSKMAYEVFGRFKGLEDKKKGFSDIDSHWAKEFIEILAGNGYLKGDPDGSFRPDDNITRAEASKIIAAYDKGGEKQEIEPPKANNAIKGEVLDSKQERATIAMISAKISKPDGNLFEKDKVSAYMVSAESGQRLDFTVSPSADGKVYYLYFDEKYLNPGETYTLYGAADGNVNNIKSSSFYRNTMLGKVYEADGNIYYKRDNTPMSNLTVKNMLIKATEPLGRTLYVWGGGWNEEDTGPGIDSMTMGVSPRWFEFFNSYGSGYDYNKTRYQIRDGLDCSGYIGWLIYNTLNTESNKDGYVMLADRMAANYASRGWGSFTSKSGIKSFKPGDIMSSPSHVYMVIGTAKDGSVVVIHASPAGVKLCGTPTPGGVSYSEAVKLSEYYMETYRPEFYKKFPNMRVNNYYLRGFDQMSWDVSGNGVLTDPDGITNMSAEEVLYNIFAQ